MSEEESKVLMRGRTPGKAVSEEGKTLFRVFTVGGAIVALGLAFAGATAPEAGGEALAPTSHLSLQP